MELYGVPIPDEKLASKLHHGLSQNFGTAGPAFVQRILKELDEKPEAFKEDYDAMFNKLSEMSGDNITSHLSAVAVVCMADYYASRWIFGIDDKQAFSEAMGLAEEILKMLETASEVDDGTRAYEYLMSWHKVYEAHFKDDVFGKRFGFYRGEDYLCVYPSVFDDALKEGGFNPRRIKSDWADRGWIQTGMKNGRRRYVVQQRTPDNGRAYVVSIKL